MPIASAIRAESNVCYAAGITQDPNICYATGVMNEPEYAEIQNGLQVAVIATKVNEAYGKVSQVIRQEVVAPSGQEESSQSSPDSVCAHEQSSQRNSTIDE